MSGRLWDARGLDMARLVGLVPGMPKNLDAHVYPPGSLRPEKRRLDISDSAVAMHQLSRRDAVPGCSLVKLVQDGVVVSHFIVTAKGPSRVNAEEAARIITTREPDKRSRLLSELIRGQLAAR